ncbi:MAG TPA: alpha-L-fucosidase [Gemmatirosa sp.]
MRRAVRRAALVAAAVAMAVAGAARGATAQGAARAVTPPPARYDASWASLDRRPVPAWYDSAKFGIFVHWGVYSVPAWAPTGANVPVYEKYAEWYERRVRDDSARGGPFWRFHARTYGAGVPYRAFAPQFRAELWDPAAWAALFARSGAGYVVLTAKHHDGFALWPSAQSPGWSSGDAGPKRDLAGDLAAAVRARGLRMGFYYSLYEWYHPLYTADTTAAGAARLRRYVDAHMLPQLRDLVTRYRPAVLWTDGEWEHPSAAWRSPEFLAWLFTDGPNPDEVVVNDRWGSETRGHHGGIYTSEYGIEHLATGDAAAAWHKWEETRAVGGSFGYNRAEALGDYHTGGELVRLLVETVAKGGNLLLDVGPTADGRIPVIMQERLTAVGDWLRVNGEAIYGTRRWRVSADPVAAGGPAVRYTARGGAARGDTVYAIALGDPGAELVLSAPTLGPAATVALLGYPGPLRWRAEGGRLHVTVPRLSPDGPVRHAYVFRLTGGVT